MVLPTKPLKPLDWLAIQNLYFDKPKKGGEALLSGEPLFFPPEILKKSEADLQAAEKRGFQIAPLGDFAYPPLLKEIYDPPLVLMMHGARPHWGERKWIAVVGARKASRWGLQKTTEIVRELVASGCGIISGFAYGVDAQAHKTCIEMGGVTWGVLGSGLDRIYPRRNFALAAKMVAGGGLLSEFPLGMGPFAQNFPQRNRTISGIASAVIMVEATEKSGSLITARFALEQGRDVFVVEPPDTSVLYGGNIRWLEQGAAPFRSAQQLWKSL